MNASPDLLFADTLVKRFGALLATDHATLRVARGEIHALIGPNGAGKTTLIHQLAGTLAPDSGRIHFDGQDVSARPIHQRAHLGLVRSYQITNVFLRLTVLDNLALALLAHEKGSLLAWWRPARRDRQRYGEALALAQRVGLGEQAQSLVSTLSHGQRRQLEVGLALALKPKLLLLDEPMAGMGPDESARMLALLQSLKGETTMLLVEHDMDAVFRLADRISVLVFGKIIASGTPDEIRQHPEVRRAYLGDELEQTP